ncbi:MAG: alcohol dehydrogenase catalytic domain-containing protein [Alphaproteobacteria bacterium]
MRAAIFHEIGKPLTIGEVPDLAPGDGELILKVSHCGICGSDLHSTEAGLMTLPGGSIMGHEFSGEIVAVGRNAGGVWKTGQKVAALPVITCGACPPCLRGEAYTCDKVSTIGLGQSSGAYAEYVKVGARDTVLLPQSVSLQEGALIEPLAVGYHAVEKSDLRPGGNVLIIGAGPVGLAVTLFSRFVGARHIIVSERSEGRAAMAARFGATDVVNANDDVMAQFRQKTGTTPDVIFECVGVPGMISDCMKMAPRGGKIVVAGVCSKPDTILPLMGIMKEITLQFVLAYRRQDFDLIAGWMAADRIDALAMVTDTVGFADFPAAFEALRTPSSQCKVMLKPDLG